MNGRGLFFKPIPFGNQLPDLAVQLIDLPLLGLLRPLPFAGERFWNRRKRLFLPSVDLGGVNTILRRQLIAGFLLTDRLQGHFGLELDRMPFTYSCHVSPGLSLLPSILKAGLEYGEYHNGRILSTDERDFETYRWKQREPFKNLLVDYETR